MAKLILGINDLNTTNPDLEKEACGWDPKTISAGSKKKQKWICEQYHEWIAEVKSRTRQKSGCPVCFGRKVLSGFNDLQTKYPLIAKEAKGWDPKLISAGSHKKFKWQCELGHEWQDSPNHRTSNKRGCFECAKNGFNPYKPAYLYLISNDNLKMFKVGISNYPDQRISQHKSSGWKLVEVIGPKDGYQIRSLESSIIQSLKKIGIILPTKNVPKFNGYTESWLKSEYFVNNLNDLIEITK